LLTLIYPYEAILAIAVMKSAYGGAFESAIAQIYTLQDMKLVCHIYPPSK
jgi:hypothetical protein